MFFIFYRILYIYGYIKLDFIVWYIVIEKVVGIDGNVL